MSRSLFYLMTFLPSLPPLGGKPPIALQEISRLISEEDGGMVEKVLAAIAAEGVFKTFLRQKFVDSEKSERNCIPAELSFFSPETREELANDRTPEEEADLISKAWKEYFSYLGKTGNSAGIRLISRWATREKKLREALAEKRSNPSAALSSEHSDFSDLLLAWQNAENPWVAEQILDRARWNFLDEACGHYSFSGNEFAAYVLKLGILIRYAELDSQKGMKILEEVSNP